MATGKTPARLEWESWTLRPDEIRSKDFGPLRIWAQRAEKEWKLAWRVIEEVRERKRASAPPAPEWTRWAAPERDTSVRFSPCLPDLPLVAKPENPFHILPSERARIYVSVPVWVRVSVGEEPLILLAEIPSLVLSKTWSGTPSEGELCLWTRTRARRDLESTAEHIVTAPLVLANRSKDPLRIEKVYLRLPHLGMYDGEGSLWTDTTQLNYKGPGEYETIQEEGKAPLECPEAPLLTAPREKPKSGLASLSFSPLKALSGWDY